MLNLAEMARPRIGKVNWHLDRLLYIFSTHALPIILAMMSVLALFAWQSQYPSTTPQQLNFQVAALPQDIAYPHAALDLLKQHPRLAYHDTLRSEAPVWISFTASASPDEMTRMIEFPSRHAMEIACWDAVTLNSLGQGSRTKTSGGILAIKSGFALELGLGANDRQIVCQTNAVGPARLTVQQWSSEDLKKSAREFDRNSGLLDGGILILAMFMLVTALINRSGLYILFAAWLVINLRMGALSAGWDTQWLGSNIPQEWLMRVRSVTLALYYLLTVTLFKVLFREELSKVGSLTFLQIAQWTCIPLVLLSAVASYQSFLPYIWVSTALSIGVLVYYLVRILATTRSAVAIWYTASITITLAASLYEVVSAALGLKGLIGSVNSVTAALSSSLLAALAIAEQMRQEHDQRLEMQKEMAHTFYAMPIGLFTLDLQGRFLRANPALRAMLSQDVLSEGKNLWQQYFTDGAWIQLYNMVHNKRRDELEIKGLPIPGSSGSTRFLVNATLSRDKIEGSLQDVTEKSRASENLQFLATHDSLTKALNRRGIETVLSRAIEDLTDGDTLALAYLDLDRFKLINDLYGHGSGDEVLRQVCKRITDMLSRDIRFGRVGGDEFVIVFPQTNITLAKLLCKGVIESIDTLPCRVGDKAFFVRVSIGLVEVNPAMRFNDAMSTADRACREAKTSSSGGLVVYEKFAVAFQQHEAELKLITQLSTTTATDGLYLEMQPIMSLTKPHESLNFEVLLRMRGVDGKLVPTDRLIAAGECSGRMDMIDLWVLSSTLEWLKQNIAQMKHTKFICVNLNGSSLNDERFLDKVYDMLEDNLDIAGQLCLEITESVALHDLENTRRFIDRVRGYGAKVALDDFGAGYTSFSYLKEFTADLLKIDGSFIVDMNKHPANIAIVEAIVSLAKNLGMKVIAEWAEDNATVQTLTEIGVDYVQGFAVAHPQHPDRLLAAKSSASSIVDEELTQYAFHLGKTDPMLAQVDLFPEQQYAQVH
jgi:diguanylate cyclase (GGDEF)-like protein